MKKEFYKRILRRDIIIAVTVKIILIVILILMFKAYKKSYEPENHPRYKHLMETSE